MICLDLLEQKELMSDLNEKEIFELTKEELRKLQSVFSAVHSNDSFGKEIIQEYLNDGYLMDPHTATCLKAYNELKVKDLKSVMYSTAEWTKFSPTVLNALNNDEIKYADKEALEKISSKCGALIPKQISELFEAQIKHTTVINKENIEEEIIKFIS